jgi:predicted dehydrogenase
MSDEAIVSDEDRGRRQGSGHMPESLRIAVVGVGRIGLFHARHVQAVARRTGMCELVAVVDEHGETADRVAAQLRSEADDGGKGVRSFRSVDDFLASGVSEAAVVASRTADHERHGRQLVEGGQRILLEKPLTHSVESAANFARDLNSSDSHQQAVMIGFMRRFDAALIHAKEFLDAGAIGRLFKVVSILEDPVGQPTGYSSSGILSDMAVHNADEVLWLTGKRPTAIEGFGARLHNQHVSDVEEDFDDGFVQLRFAGGDGDLIAQIVVSRNHVAGYRNETLLYGDEGMIHVGRFCTETEQVHFEAVGKGGHIIESQVFTGRRHTEAVPMFIERFAAAFVAEVEHFVHQCHSGEAFCVDHNDGLRALEVVEAGMRSQRELREGVAIVYESS